MSSKGKLSRATASTKTTAKRAKTAPGNPTEQAKSTPGDQSLDIAALTAEITKTVTNTVMDSLRQAGLVKSTHSTPAPAQNVNDSENLPLQNRLLRQMFLMIL